MESRYVFITQRGGPAIDLWQASKVRSPKYQSKSSKCLQCLSNSFALPRFITGQTASFY
jgi:hypothetical protein